jgi:hypothetical protein
MHGRVERTGSRGVLRAIEQRSRPIVLDQQNTGTRGVRLICTLCPKQENDNTFSFLKIPPPLCRACRPTPRRHSAENQGCFQLVGGAGGRSCVVASGRHVA